jgi:hypothetical protein
LGCYDLLWMPYLTQARASQRKYGTVQEAYNSPLFAGNSRQCLSCNRIQQTLHTYPINDDDRDKKGLPRTSKRSTIRVKWSYDVVLYMTPKAFHVGTNKDPREHHAGTRPPLSNVEHMSSLAGQGIKLLNVYERPSWFGFES